VPIIGIDFSMANLTMNDASFCLHSLKPGVPNDYIEALKGLYESFTCFSNFKLAYGFGARTMERPDGSLDACDLFSMSGDIQDPFVDDLDEILACYQGTLKTVRLALPVNYTAIIQFVCDLAESDFQRIEDSTQCTNYYVLVLLMAGVIDDLQSALNQILRAKNIPVSIIIVKVGNIDE